MASPPEVAPSSSADGPVARWVAAIVALLATALFASTHSPAIQAADSGELVAAACGLGVAHPPGYPLHTLLGFLACKLPFSTAASRVGLVSLLAGVVAVLLAFGVVRRLTQSLWAAATAALIFATGALFWRYASLAEVFALNAALCLAVLYTVLRAVEVAGCGAARDLGRWLWLLAASLLWGLALCNHLSSVWLAPLLLLPLVSPWPGLGRFVVVSIGCVVALAVGLSPYLQIVWADPLALPRWGDPATAAGFVHHVLRRDYGSLQLAIGGRGSPLGAPLAFVAEAPRQLGWLLSPLALWGALLAGSRAVGRPLGALAPTGMRRDLAAALVLLPLVCGPLFLLMFNIPLEGIGRQVVERFFILPIALGVPCLGIGLVWLEGWLGRVAGAARARLWRGAVLVFVGLMALLAFPRADVSESWAIEDYADNALSMVEKGALVVGRGDVKIWSMLHAQQVRGVRRDVQYVDVMMLAYRWYVDQQRRLHPGFAYRHTPGRMDSLRLILGALRRGRAVYLTGYYNRRVRTAFATYPSGPLLRVVDPNQRMPELREILDSNRRFFRGFRRRGRIPRPSVDPWSASLREPFAATWRALGHQLHRRGARVLARRALRQSILWAPWLAAPRWAKTLQPRRPKLR